MQHKITLVFDKMELEIHATIQTKSDLYYKDLQLTTSTIHPCTQYKLSIFTLTVPNFI